MIRRALSILAHLAALAVGGSVVVLLFLWACCAIGCASVTPSVADVGRDVQQTTQQGGLNYTGGAFGVGAVLITGSAVVLLVIENWLITLLSHKREMKRLNHEPNRK